MTMGEKDGIDAIEAERQRLRAEVRGRVDEHADPTGDLEVDDGRIRRSRGSEEPQVAQRQPIIGTPWDVPVPRNLTAQPPLTAG